MPNETIPELVLDFSYGQDARFAPDRIADNAYAGGINVSCRSGRLSPRPGLHEQNLIFDDDATYTDAYGRIKSAKELFYIGNYQSIIPYTIGSTRYLAVTVAGMIFLINVETRKVILTNVDNDQDSVADYGLNPNQIRVNWSFANKYINLFDPPNTSVILDNYNAQRADTLSEFALVARLGCYNHNRMFVTNLGNEFTAGDPVGALQDGAIKNILAPITFGEVMESGTSYTGQIFQLNTDYANEPITAMGFVPLTDTTTGVGPMFIATERQIFTAQTHNPRPSWEQTAFVTNISNYRGIAGQRAFTAVGSDIYYITPNWEICTLNMTREEQKKYARVPISREVQNWIQTPINQDLAQFAFAGYHDNSVYFACRPKRVQAISKDGYKIVDYAFSGMVVLELDNVSGFGIDSRPAWAGVYTGLDFQDMCVSGTDCYIFAKNSQGRNGIYLLDKERRYDVFNKVVRPIRSRIYTKEHQFYAPQIADPFAPKELKGLHMSFKDVDGDFRLVVRYKPDQGIKFIDWKEYQHRTYEPSNKPQNTNTFPYYNRYYMGHSLSPLYLGSPTDTQTCDEISETVYSFARKVQLQLNITGLNWELDSYKIEAILRDEKNPFVECDIFKEPIGVWTEGSTDFNLYKDDTFVYQGETLCQQTT